MSFKHLDETTPVYNRETRELVGTFDRWVMADGEEVREIPQVLRDGRAVVLHDIKEGLYEGRGHDDEGRAVGIDLETGDVLWTGDIDVARTDALRQEWAAKPSNALWIPGKREEMERLFPLELD